MPGRTFYDEDDPFFQAVDLWYGVTMDKEVCILPCNINSMVLTPLSGTTPTRSRQTRESWKLDLTISKITTWHSDLACSKAGTSFVSREADWRPVCLFLVMVTSKVSGLDSGPWVILAALVMLLPQMVFGLTATMMDVMLVSHPTRVLQMESALCLACVFRDARVPTLITPLPAALAVLLRLM